MDVNWRGVTVLVLFFEVSGSMLMLAIVSTRVKSSSNPYVCNLQKRFFNYACATGDYDNCVQHMDISSGE